MDLSLRPPKVGMYPVLLFQSLEMCKFSCSVEIAWKTNYVEWLEYTKLLAYAFPSVPEKYIVKFDAYAYLLSMMKK